MLIAAKVLDWLAVALWIVGRAPTVVPWEMAVLPYAMALIAFRKDATSTEKWTALAANAIAVAYYTWVLLDDVVSDDPSPLWAISVFVAYNIVPCTINTMVLYRIFVWASDETEPSSTHPPAGW